jgi:hypothetical protein
MAKVEIDPGVCGHSTTVTATKADGYVVRLEIESGCPHVRKIGESVTEVDALKQIGLRGGLPPLLQTSYECCAHAACPVPAGLVKAVEVEAGLALPRNVTMQISKEG